MLWLQREGQLNTANLPAKPMSQAIKEARKIASASVFLYP